LNRSRVLRLAKKVGFPPKRWRHGRDGLHAQYDSRDRLRQLYWLVEGSPGRWHLSLLPAEASGELVLNLGEGRTDLESYGNGCWESFDAFSDNRRPSQMSWRAWTRRSVLTLMNGHRCLLCASGVGVKSAFVWTPDDYDHLCKPCWVALGTQAPQPRSWPIGDRMCGACLNRFEDEALMYEGKSGKLCLDCKEQMKRVGLGLW
jgi:hypothetical protein